MKTQISKYKFLVPLLMMSGLSIQTITGAEIAPSETEAPLIVRKDSVKHAAELPEDMVVVGNDTISMIIPEKNYGRYDRGLFNYLYITKGSWAIGLTASYGSLNTEDLQMLSTVEDLDFDGEIYSIHPSVAYFIRHNQSLGLRMIYTHGRADLANMGVDLGEDLSFALHDVGYKSNQYKVGLFYRNYVGLNRNKLFAVFNEVSLDFGHGRSNFTRYYDDVLYDTQTTSTNVSLNFSPGVCVFIQDYVAFNISFGVFGIKLNSEKQKTNGIEEGSRFSSGANFRFNIFNINFGLMVVI